MRWGGVCPTGPNQGVEGTTRGRCGLDCSHAAQNAEGGVLAAILDSPAPSDPSFRLHWAGLVCSWLCWLRQASLSQAGEPQLSRALWWACVCWGKGGVMLVAGRAGIRGWVLQVGWAEEY